jgi:VIT1/CCC1 family predicted Fe2+/Mn2+ transporter
MTRESIHAEPAGATATARHYIRDLVYGANDGLITTFAVVSGVAGGSLAVAAVVIIGAANLVADGISMGVGNFLSIRADERAREAAGLPEQEAFPWKHAVATLCAFVGAGVIPLLPYLVPYVERRLLWSSASTFAALFALGASRATVTSDRWWRSGLETLLLGDVVGAAAYGAGLLGAIVVGGQTIQ